MPPRSDLRSLARLAAPALVIGSLLSSTSARAESHFGVGLMGTVGGNFLDKPDRQVYEPDIYPGYGGVNYGGGLVLDGRVLHEILGLEVDVIRSVDKGSGDVTFTSGPYSLKVTHTLGQPAWHVPLLLKATVPSPFLGVQFMLGPEFVFPSDPESKTDPVLTGVAVTGKADTYTMITGGVGLEIKVHPGIDLRVPISLRFSYNPGVPSQFADRVKVTSNTAVQYDSEWKFAAGLTAGVAAYF